MDYYIKYEAYFKYSFYIYFKHINSFVDLKNENDQKHLRYVFFMFIPFKYYVTSFTILSCHTCPDNFVVILKRGYISFAYKNFPVFKFLFSYIA